ncbi:MAG: peptidoglycan DD-metalloendopeptidase family protein [Bacteroidales bacterium]|nr:peptidoglycan DD-metalloendopeptidase family protein [Bacteroidales bacterium]
MISCHHRLHRLLLIALSLCLTVALSVTVNGAKPKRDIEKLKKEQRQTEQAIIETSQKINTNTNETKRQLDRLDALTSEISTSQENITTHQSNIDSIAHRINTLKDSINLAQNDLEALRRGYRHALQQMQLSQSSMSTLAFIFSSQSFAQAWQRLRYLQQFATWRREKTRQIEGAIEALNTKKNSLANLQRAQVAQVDSLQLAHRRLQSQRQETDQLVNKLRKEGKSLKETLRQQEAQAREFDRELDRLIAEEMEAQKKQKQSGSKKKKGAATAQQPAAGSKAPVAATNTSEVANSRLTGSFESNKGRLPFPIEGRYRIERGFGRQKHPSLPHVETDNSGVDIEALSTTTARCVFDGQVSAVFQQPGYNTIVMVRHGDYLTVYANLASINVKAGDTVKARQSLGTIYRNPESGNRAILHFELRHERTKLNPLQWIK